MAKNIELGTHTATRDPSPVLGLVTLNPTCSIVLPIDQCVVPMLYLGLMMIQSNPIQAVAQLYYQSRRRRRAHSSAFVLPTNTDLEQKVLVASTRAHAWHVSHPRSIAPRLPKPSSNTYPHSTGTGLLFEPTRL